MGTASPLLGERMARHGLGSRPATTAADAARLTTAVQAQDQAAARLGVRSRARGLTDAAVLRALEDERTVVRTWLMRGTIHLVDTTDLRWLVRLIGPAVARRFATRWRQLGLTEPLLDRVAAALPEVLADGPLERARIRAALAERGILLPDQPQADVHALLHAATRGVVCRGPHRGREITYALTASWVPAAPAGPEGDEALAELARRYFAAFSPATAADFTTWSGLPSGRAVALVRDELTPLDVDGRPGFRLGEVAPAGGVRLLAAFDNYLIGYRDRTAILPPELHRHVYRGGMISPTVLYDGRVVGTWALDRTRGRVTVAPFEPLGRTVQRAVDEEVEDLARFLERDLTVVQGASARASGTPGR